MIYERVRASIIENLRQAAKRVLMLDYDGTLAPFHSDRDLAVPYPGVIEILEQLEAKGKSRVMIVSGRTVEDIIPLLNMKSPPEIWGSHGWERRGRDGNRLIWPANDRLLDGLRIAEEFIDNRGLIDYCEIKPRSLAFHWRGRNDDRTKKAVLETKSAWQTIRADYGLDLREFDGGLELRIPGRTKGDVVRSIIKESGPESFLAYLGDDNTDEDAFRAMEGHGISFLVREEFRSTGARYHLKPPDELIRFLNDWLENE